MEKLLIVNTIAVVLRKGLFSLFCDANFASFRPQRRSKRPEPVDKLWFSSKTTALNPWAGKNSGGIRSLKKPRTVGCSGWPGSSRHDCPRQPPPHTRPNAVQVPLTWAPLHPHSENGTQGSHGRDRGLPVGVCPFPESGCGPRPQMRQAAACGKLGSLLAPPEGE